MTALKDVLDALYAPSVRPPLQNSSGATPAPPSSSGAVAGQPTATPSGPKGKLLRVLIFFRLVNGDNNISLSNIAVICMLVKLMLAPEIDLASAAALLTVIGGYNWKRYISSTKR